MTTTENQEIEIEGVLVWKVLCEEDVEKLKDQASDLKKLENTCKSGPHNAYKSYEDLSKSPPRMTNDSLASKAQGVVRDNVSKCKLDELMKQRNLIRDRIKVQLQKDLKGTGIKIETVEITDIYICNTQTFIDMQMRHRDNKRREA